MPRSRTFKVGIGLLVSLGFLTWIFVSTDWSAVQSHLTQLSWPWFLVAVLVTLLHYVLRAFRWRLLLPAETQTSVLVRFDSIMLGNLATFLLPLRAGEFVRPWLLTRHSDVSFATGFASVVVERFFDLSAVLLAFAFIVNASPLQSEALLAGAWGLGGIAAGICVFLILGSFLPSPLIRLVRYVLRPFPHKFSSTILHLVENILAGASLLRSPWRACGVLVLTAVIWCSSYWIFDIFLRLFQFPSTLLFVVSIGVTVALAVALPSAPGFIGVYQTACVLVFQAFGLSQEQAVAYSLVNHLFQYVIFVLYGLVLFTRYEIGLSALKPTQKEN